MRDDEAHRRRQRTLWRRRLTAVAWALAIHLALFAVIASDWARHRSPPPPQVFEVTLERPNRPVPPPILTPQPKVERPLPPAPPASAAFAISPNLRMTPPSTVPRDSGVAPLIARPSRTPAGPLVAPEQAVNLGCLTKGLVGKAKADCEQKTYVTFATPGEDDPRAYATLGGPPGPKAKVPGWSGNARGPPGTIGAGAVFMYGANDKHFLPFQGDTKTTVFEPAKVLKSDLPPPMR